MVCVSNSGDSRILSRNTGPSRGREEARCLPSRTALWGRDVKCDGGGQYLAQNACLKRKRKPW